ncbi:hypothetical protein Nepgr_010772 [Nepenthes gracilis]|uniref:Anaphase-promoting complex subunit 4 WD40 domain-containing protein n=1 Tax=Nepenthes gracilis TaxID=150966 RepID=A0AAD3SD94_NEPGR|nr:hypothetical protein Nepgr_010772 [Nepenthes gracilis]
MFVVFFPAFEGYGWTRWKICSRKDIVVEFFRMIGNDLLQKGEEWTPWFAITYLKNPSMEPQFRIYFSKDWFEALLTLGSFFGVLGLLFHFKWNTLQAVLEEKETQLSQFRSEVALMKETSSSKYDVSGISASGVSQESAVPARDSYENHSPFTSRRETEIIQHSDVAGAALNLSDITVYNAISSANLPGRDDGNGGIQQASQYGFYSGGNGVPEKAAVALEEEEFLEVKVNFQETFLGHTSPISKSRFSASGNNIASASMDGTVRIWTYDSSTTATRNATIYCGAEILSLDWECKSDRLLLIGTADGAIKAWNVDAKRVVCDLSTAQTFQRVLDIKSSPVEPIFVSAAASAGDGSSCTGTMGYASLTVWNMRTWKAMTVLPLGEDPPAITSLCFNHNGKILAASAVDGMIHMFDMSAGLQITGWPAHDSAISSILFGPDETSIFSLGSDGKIFEWSLQNQGRVLWSTDCSRFCIPNGEKHYRHEMALDATGKRLLVTSDSVRSPIYQVRGYSNGLKTLPHSGAITTVDWHPTLPLFLTGSSDHSVRVTSIL